MGIRELANRHNRAILNNSATGGGWPFTITDPAGNTAALTGWSNDIAQVIDPDTGQAVSGRLATVTMHLQDLEAQGLAIPSGENFSNAKPWLVTWDDLRGNAYKFKISSADPDRTINNVTCILEAWDDGS